MADEITNSEDLISARELTERITELSDLADADGISEEELDELAALRGVQDQAENRSGSPQSFTLIRDSHFADYARDYAEDAGLISEDWPSNHVNWDAAALELRIDYGSVDFGGVTYWVRS